MATFMKCDVCGAVASIENKVFVHTIRISWNAVVHNDSVTADLCDKCLLEVGIDTTKYRVKGSKSQDATVVQGLIGMVADEVMNRLQGEQT